MYKNFEEFLEVFQQKTTEKIQSGLIDIGLLMTLTSEVIVLADAAAHFEALVTAMSERGFETFDEKTLLMTKETNQKMQDTYASIIAVVDGV